MNKLIPRLRKKVRWECQYDKCHQKMATREARNLHHARCKKRTDSEEDIDIYEQSLAFLTPKQREDTRESDYGKNRLRRKHRRSKEFDDVSMRQADKLLKFAERYKSPKIAVDMGLLEKRMIHNSGSYNEQMIRLQITWNNWEILAEDMERNCLIVKVPLGGK